MGVFSSVRRRTKDSRGQSSLEFVLTLTLLIGFVLFFVQLALALAYGNYVHYATFMAARAYLSGGVTPDDQRERAKQVIIKMLKKSEGQTGEEKYPFIAEAVGGDEVKGLSFDTPQTDRKDRDFARLQGVRYTFKTRLFMLPFARLQGAGASSDKSKGSLNSLTLTSESFLGREASYSSCVDMMKAKEVAYYDNGC